MLDAPSPVWFGTVLALDLPSTIAPGPHEVSLLGVAPAREADACTSPLRPSGEIATATVFVGG